MPAGESEFNMPQDNSQQESLSTVTNADSKIDVVITSRERDIGGFSVRRFLPYATHRMVGPFIFFDHMGPAEFSPGHGVDVRPHPHINLATVTYLFEGEIRHRDSLGSDQVIEAGAINWMTAGRGIVHSEHTTERTRASGAKVNGIQLWVALPEKSEECDPSFSHHPKDSFAAFEKDGVLLKVLLGEAYGQRSVVDVHSPLFYVEALMPKASKLDVEGHAQEAAFYIVSGTIRTEEQTFATNTMVVLKAGQDLEIEALTDARVMLLGGQPVGPRFLYWNFVSSSQQRLEEAKRDWEPGPRKSSARFQPIPGDQNEFIPLPEEPMKPTASPL